jgi:hypothetical protein
MVSKEMGYDNFEVAIYCTVDEVLKIAAGDPAQLRNELDKLAKRVRFSKVYLESFRGEIFVDREKLIRAKAFFQANGIQTSGAIAPVLGDPTDFITSASIESDFVSFCYSNPVHKDTLGKIVRRTAELFDEIIIDDFFFTNCRCESCIAAKGSLSWPEYRIDLMRRISEEIIIKTAKQVNPDVKLIIKYPNWYDDYQSTGYDLEKQSRQFDAIYTGTETRNPNYTQQTVQRYDSYFLMRYLENARPGHNAGAWYDTIDCLYNIGSYVEQGYLSLFAKAREVTLFCWGLLEQEGLFPAIAGHVFAATDQFLAELGNPFGIACYKPYHSSGESYLHGYLGMLGLPLEPTPVFSTGTNSILLTQSAAHDPAILAKIANHLRTGKNVMITSGLLKALQDQGLAELTGVRYTDHKVSLSRFGLTMFESSFREYCDVPEKITIPALEYNNNDCTPVIMGFSTAKSYPVLLRAKYGAGSLLILTIPEDFGELYQYPAPALNLIRSLIMADLPVRLEAPSQIGIFLYANDTVIVESFLPYNVTVTIVIKKSEVKLLDLLSGQEFAGKPDGAETRFPIHLTPTTYRVFKYC